MDSSLMEADLFNWLTEGNGVDFTQGAKDSPSLDLAWCDLPSNQDDLPAWMESRGDVGTEKYNLFEDVFLHEDLHTHGNWMNSDPPVIPLADTSGVPVCTAPNAEDRFIKNEVPTSCHSNVTPVSTIPPSTSAIPESAVLSSAMGTSSPTTIIPTTSVVSAASSTPISNKTPTSTPRVIIKVLKVNVPSKSKGVHVVPYSSITGLQADVEPEYKNTPVHPTVLPQSCLPTPPQSPERKLSNLPSEEPFMDSDCDQLLNELVNIVGSENAEFDLESSIHALDDVDEYLSHLDSDGSESEPPSPLSSQNHSLSAFSPVSPDDVSVPSSSFSKADSCYGKTKSPRTRRSEPYIADLKQRKKEQNKRAALRYRQKKKQEEDDVARMLKVEEDKQQELKNKYHDLKQEIGYLKKLMRDVFIAKGLISAEELKK